MGLSQLPGVLIGGLCTLLGVLLAYKLAERKRRKQEAELLQGVLQGLHDEIETLWDMYTDRVGSQLETLPEGQGLEFYWAARQDYFTVYTSNCHLIGRITDVDLRKEIISTYATAKSLIDTFEMNNQLVSWLEEARILARETQNETHIQQIALRREQVASYAVGLKAIHEDLKTKTSGLLRRLRKLGVLNQGRDLT